MVKKKVKKKRNISKKKILKKKRSKKVISKNNSLARRDFEAFKIGVQKLKELEKELNSLDTRGFSKEEQAIRSKLKTVSEIPNIERAMKKLKLKINHKYKPKKRNKAPMKEIHEDIEDVKKEIKKLKKSNYKTPIVDSEVDILVDTNFNDFLITLKKALSDRLKNKELEMDDVLKKDLEKREFKYKKKHDNLLKDFERNKNRLEDSYKKKYKQKVESELHKEVSKDFNIMLKKKFDKERVQLGKAYKTKLKNHSDEILEEKKRELEESIKKKRERFENYREKERKKMKDALIDKFHKQFVEDLAKKESEIRRQLKNEYEIRLKKKVQEHEEELKKKKLGLELEMQKKIKQLLN